MERLGPNFHICCLCSGSWGVAFGLCSCAAWEVNSVSGHAWWEHESGLHLRACQWPANSLINLTARPVKGAGSFLPPLQSLEFSVIQLHNTHYWEKKYSHSFSLKKTDFLKSQIPTFQWTVAEDKECALFLNRCKNNNNKRYSAFQANLTIFKPGSWFFSCFTMTMPSLCCQTAKKAHSVSPKYQRNEQNQIGLHSSDGVYVSCSDAVP